MTPPLDPHRRSRQNRGLITLVIGVFVVAILGIALWGGVETSSIESVPDEASAPAPGEGSSVTGATTQPPAPVTEDVAPSNNPVATE
ncbi:hypothetical protein [Chthonobacter albigriseus]|uniref:hypothetical protein n=1 Tax=Chthonobacter albigriseus TaxID=1683161 RepID=UPI0015EF00C4|nr:hypothetical protein [Chthonobacter albigriseus]